MTNTQALSWQTASVPNIKNFIFLDCSECGRENMVHKKDHAVAFTCSMCYGSKT